MIVFNQVFDAPFLVFIAKIALAMLLGIVLGIERIYAHKNAGMRTYALVSMSAAFFVLIAQSVVATTGTPLAIDAVARMASQIIVKGVPVVATTDCAIRTKKAADIDTSAYVRMPAFL
jgi:uncharacterized membrane protein YhiD involved in acid resistance